MSSYGEIPNITGDFETGVYTANCSGAFQNYNTSGHYEAGTYRTAQISAKTFNANLSSSVYVNNISRVMPAVIAVQFLIKYI